MAELKELEATITGLQKELSEMKAQKPAVVTVEYPKELAAIPGVMKELSDGMAALSKRLDAIEKDGTPATGTTDARELGAIETFATFDAKAGTLKGND